jgi:hypothetical protein
MAESKGEGTAILGSSFACLLQLLDFAKEFHLTEPITKSALAEAEQRLVELLQVIDYGRVEGLRVVGGQPVLDPPPQVVQTRKMGSRTGPREEIGLQDFWLKQPVIDLIQTIREIGDGEILSITVMHGLPHVVEVRHHVQP